MYNRYIPQPDGSFRRNHIPDPSKPRPPEPAACEVPSPPPCPTPEPPQKPTPPPPCRQEQSAGSFLRRLLPRNLQAEDLLVIVLLLLMAGDCPEDQNMALLTLALYMFM